MALPPGAFSSAVTRIETSTACGSCKACFEYCAMFLHRVIVAYTSGELRSLWRRNGGDTHSTARWLDFPGRTALARRRPIFFRYARPRVAAGRNDAGGFDVATPSSASDAPRA